MHTTRKRSLTLNLSDEEMEMLDALAALTGLSKSAFLRQLIRAEHRKEALCPERRPSSG